MGSPKDDSEGGNDEKPQHEVAVSDFYLGKFPVTQVLWQVVVNEARMRLVSDPPGITLNNPSFFRGDDRPVEQVTWYDACAFIKMLNNLTQSSRPKDLTYRLASEAEWEYAARGGKYHEEGYKYAGSDRMKDIGWFGENSGGETKPVGLKKPNQLGLYDMSGNVWEWCEDDWHNNYEGAPKNSFAWVNSPERRAHRVYRGGSWLLEAQYCRVAYRGNFEPGRRDSGIGFRLALSLQ